MNNKYIHNLPFGYIPNIFDTQTTGSQGLSPENKTFYEKQLIKGAEPKLVHDQFGDKYPIPRNGGKTIEFRKYSSLSKALVPLTEGVTPNGNSLNVTAITSQVEEYGDWIGMSDILDLTAIDNNIVQATELLSSQAGRTLDTVTREKLNAGTNVIYAPTVSGTTVTETTYRHQLDSSAKLTPDVIFKAKTTLAAMNADPIGDGYVAIIHPYTAYDLMRNAEWIDVNKYGAPDRIYRGEIGKLGGIRFVESSEAKIIKGKPLCGSSYTLTVKSYSSKVVTVSDQLTTSEAAALVGLDVIIDGVRYTITAATAYVAAVGAGSATDATFTVSDAPESNYPAANDVVYRTDCGASGCAVFSTLVIGAHAYGLTEITGGGLQHIIKQLGYGDDPLNQRSSCGWKAIKTAEILSNEFMVRIESGGTYSTTATAN